MTVSKSEKAAHTVGLKNSPPPFDLRMPNERAALIKKSGINFNKHSKTLELHIYTPL